MTAYFTVPLENPSFKDFYYISVTGSKRFKLNPNTLLFKRFVGKFNI